MQIRRFIRLLFLLALLIPAAGCQGSQCDTCNTDEDCDDGQTCRDSTLGRRCFLIGDNTCEVGF